METDTQKRLLALGIGGLVLSIALLLVIKLVRERMAERAKLAVRDVIVEGVDKSLGTEHHEVEPVQSASNGKS